MHINLTRNLVEKSLSIKWESLCAGEQQTIRHHVLDTCAVCIGGTHINLNRRLVFGQMKRLDILSLSDETSTESFSSVADTAFLLAAVGHATEFDDGFRRGSFHPGVTIVPGAFLLALKLRLRWKDFYEAVASGYEFANRVAEAIHPVSRKRGFHNTAIVGVLGASVAASRLLGLDHEETESAIGIAATYASGLFTFLTGGDTKPLHAGQATRNGLEAALLVRDGMWGAYGVLEDQNGFVAAFSNPSNLDRIQIDGAWRFMSCYIKPYACCRHLHPTIDATLAILAENNLCADDIAKISIKTYGIAALHDIPSWENITQAQLALRSCVPIAAIHGTVTPQLLEEADWEDERLRRLASIMSVKKDNSCDEKYPQFRPAIVDIDTMSGSKYSLSIDTPLGSPENPLDELQLVDKARKQLCMALPEMKADSFIEDILNGDATAGVSIPKVSWPHDDVIRRKAL